jgi:hypothetical protein
MNECNLREAAHQLRQDKYQDMRQKQTSASWLRPVCGGFHNLIRFNCAPFFSSCRRHRVLIVTCLDACRCATYLSVLSDGLHIHIFEHLLQTWGLEKEYSRHMCIFEYAIGGCVFCPWDSGRKILSESDTRIQIVVGLDESFGKEFSEYDWKEIREKNGER